jgi:hypothetical protein
MRENTPPFTATAKTTYEQSLPDGNEIRGYIYTHQARDSSVFRRGYGGVELS